MKGLQNQSFFSSWSGGKDSCLALFRAVQGGGKPAFLLTMLNEAGARSRAHDLHTSVLAAQSEALGIPLLTRPAAWNGYEEAFSKVLADLKVQGVEHGVFGDIDLEPHRQWVEKVCGRGGITPWLPLWQKGRRELLAEFLAAGFAATIIAVRDGKLDNSFLGRPLDRETIDDLERAGVDACGEEGEYHSVVTGGPIFSRPLHIEQGATVSRDGYNFLDIRVV